MAQDGDLRWWPRVKEAWPYATWLASILFLIGALTGIALAVRSGASSAFVFLLAITDPAASGLLLILLGLLTPDLYQPRRLTLFHVFAFPTLYAVGILLFRFIIFRAFIASGPLGIVTGSGSLPRIDRIWANAFLIGSLWAIQVLFLLFLHMRIKEDPDKLA